MAKRKRLSFFIKLFSAVAIVVAVLFGAYFAIDKIVVPKYFKDYGINNMHDLVSMVKTLYNSPDEEDFITNGFTQRNEKNAIDKLIEINVPETQEGSGILDFFAITESVNKDDLVKGDLELTDREMAAILDQMLESGVLAEKLPDIKYLDTIKMNVLELIITPEKTIKENGDVVYSTDKADVSFTFKVNTEAIRSQIASEMETPLFLLNMIMPDTLYITINYQMEQREDYWVINSSNMGLNGRTAKDSNILLNLLIQFIFPPEDKMTVDKFASECGNILLEGVDIIGKMQVKHGIGPNDSNGVILTIE